MPYYDRVHSTCDNIHSYFEVYDGSQYIKIKNKNKTCLKGNKKYRINILYDRGERYFKRT